MREGGKILAQVLDLVVKEVGVGVGTKYLDKLAEKKILEMGGWPAFKGYRKFPTSLCTCINDEVVHAPATPDRVLEEGDIVSIDVGMRYPKKTGLVTDMAVTVPVGKVSREARKLISATKKALEMAIKSVKPGKHLGDVSAAIQKEAEKNKFNVVRELVGHGVGQKVHEEPQIPNYGEPGTGPILKPGMTLAIEPMVVMGNYELEVGKNGQTYKTIDNSLAAHFEHTVLVTGKGAEILTQE